MPNSLLPGFADRIEAFHRERCGLQGALRDIRAEIKAGEITATDAAPRIARLNTEIAHVRADLAAVEADAAQRGFTLPLLREALRLRRMAPEERAEYDIVLAMYRDALGIAAPAPTGRGAGPC